MTNKELEAKLLEMERFHSARLEEMSHQISVLHGDNITMRDELVNVITKVNSLIEHMRNNEVTS